MTKLFSSNDIYDLTAVRFIICKLLMRNLLIPYYSSLMSQSGIYMRYAFYHIHFIQYPFFSVVATAYAAFLMLAAQSTLTTLQIFVTKKKQAKKPIVPVEKCKHILLIMQKYAVSSVHQTSVLYSLIINKAIFKSSYLV